MKLLVGIFMCSYCQLMRAFVNPFSVIKKDEILFLKKIHM